MLAPLLCLQACAQATPVSARDCSTHRAPNDRVILRATLENHTDKPIRFVGVLVTAAGINQSSGSGLVDYEFRARLEPHQTRTGLIGKNYDSPEYASRVESSVDSRLGTISSCWARTATYVDGSTWSVSPL
jgi:hypothetical protein